jgi:ATP-binding cassette, subfamily B, bacterial HlyB/CyaB
VNAESLPRHNGSETDKPQDAAPLLSTGLICLCVVAAHHQRAADPQQLARALGYDPNLLLSESQLLLAAKELGLAAKVGSTSWQRLTKITLPAIVELNNGEFVVLLRVDRDDHVIVGDPRAQRPQRMDRAGFEQIWSGRVVLIKTRLRLDNPNRRFDLLWFVPAVWKYRKTLYEILAASFVIQLFGLATPLFTQVIIDKVLMHKSLSTLHVLAAGMLIMIVFEAILSVLKTNLMAHTSNRIDVAFGGTALPSSSAYPVALFRGAAGGGHRGPRAGTREHPAIHHGLFHQCGAGPALYRAIRCRDVPL